ncbi:hypothetical protein AH2_0007 [Burkholderia phage vB_BceS_AH2]|uniref:Uncharacterized protein n=1 Tax=Burkholderia phage vB_BceS_AH2 TaxID=1133022 RepID=I6NP79_9CAUD|nr:hypothetical protein B613_gp07 [Burkholderia phage vB_BceS_AH2]AEY69518.1 hypothetical protein AH2_0007 [Burkholderia phage vB_BceS_AH2]
MKTGILLFTVVTACAFGYVVHEAMTAVSAAVANVTNAMQVQK